MAEIIPSLNRQTLSRMTSGEKRLAKRLQTFLEDDYLVWYDIPIGKKRRYPDFIILHPVRGLLFLEVKDWKIQTLKKINKSDVTLLTNDGLITKPSPLEQARQYTYNVIDMLSSDRQLQQNDGKFKGSLIMPYGWGVVFTNITRRQMESAIPTDSREIILPDHLIIYKDEMTESADPEVFQEQLWGMFNYQFGTPLTLPQINRVRWHMFPEVRIDEKGQINPLLDEGNDHEEVLIEQTLPDVVKIMDIQQEQLARSMGEGHRVIHGVSGSGKTLILGYRCLHLAQHSSKPILVLCYNVTLAAKLRTFISTKGIGSQVQIYHFHDWCSQQLRTYHVEVIESDRPYYERLVESVIKAVDKGYIPKAQYGALLIDEGHDFEEQWLKLIVQMVNPETDSLLLLYDDAQSIYKKQTGLGFTLSSVGVKATGRTTILRLNYRNTREILSVAYNFARHFIDPQSTDADVPLIEPEAAGNSGPKPEIRQFVNLSDEIDFVAKCVWIWNQKKVPWSDIALLTTNKFQGQEVAQQFKQVGIPYILLEDKASKKAYDPSGGKITILTIHSSKGLEFPRVIMMGLGQIGKAKDRLQQDARLLYVGMTRAQDCLLMTASQENEFCRRIQSVIVKDR